MANIKISELNSLTKKAYNDVVPIVDTSANETKKVSIEELVNNNVSLIAVSGVAPEECVEGDKYFNTTTNLIYTAIDTDTWSSTGESPIEGIFYIVFEEQTTYAYDGTTLVSVGGGASGGGETLPVGSEIDFDGQASDIPVGWEEVSGKSYVACELYSDASGTTGSITLRDNISNDSDNISNDFDWSNYKMIELVAVNNDDATETFDTYRFDTSLSKFRLMGESVGATSFNIFEKTYTKGTNSLQTTTGKLYSGSNGSVTNYDVFKIIKVIGYKEV